MFASNFEPREGIIPLHGRHVDQKLKKNNEEPNSETFNCINVVVYHSQARICDAQRKQS